MATVRHDLVRATAVAAAAELDALLEQPPDQRVELDLSQVAHVDSVGAAVLADFARRASGLGRTLRVTGMHPDIARTLQMFVVPSQNAVQPPPRPQLLERMGGAALAAFVILLEYVLLCSDVAWFTCTGLWQRKGTRWQAVASEMANMGSQAFGVVGLIAFLVGGTVALQSAAQLRQFGASLFVADLIGVSITRELGPLITAIVVAGRSGSAVAAEIGTMVVTEEVDALRTMGINPVRYLLVPKVLAISLTQPLLTVLANALAIFGGFLVAVFYLDVSPTAFMGRLEVALYVKDVLTGLFKSLLFANLIVTIGALCGMRTSGGADAVGRSTTDSVVAAIFAIILADAACSLTFYFGG